MDNVNKLVAVSLISLLSVFSVAAASSEKPLLLERAEGDAPINYYLKEGSSNTLLVLIQGSDCNSVSRNQLINETFANLIENANVLTVEKYGITSGLAWDQSSERTDCPSSYLKFDSPTQRVSDYQQLIQQLNMKSGGSPKYQKIILLGGSEGALVANMLAAKLEQHDQVVDAVIALNGGGRFFIDDVLFSMKAEIPAPAFQQAQAGFRGFTQGLLNSQKGDAIRNQVVSGHGYAWWSDMLTIDQGKVLAKIKAPLLILQSQEDKNVNPIAAKKLASEIKETQNNVQFEMLQGLDHSFKNKEAESEIREVVTKIQNWFEYRGIYDEQ